ncbi:hypothetical protein [Halomonas litopenaei]|uniref:hypothetical protein n=1 Tax=Halomonas litopenaei TaxID=2109328 RepID=UPI000C446715|nr:hypothetical protein [Halomonas sp.]|tara:strand:- start:935 stop:1606 length:672 start_codon:yes stop_codon:yes gene_type:complete
MSYHEAKEHAPGRLHRLFSSPYTAFDNQTSERRLHLLLALNLLVFAPMRQGRLTLRLLDGWENGDCEQHRLHFRDADIHRPQDLVNATPHTQSRPLLAPTLEEALSGAEANAMGLDSDIRLHPAKWPAFPGGLSLYTRYKVCHRLIYGEDDSYRSIRCETPAGLREIHEFHLEEGDFAVSLPHEDSPADSDDTVGLVLHAAQRSAITHWLADLAEQPLSKLMG